MKRFLSLVLIIAVSALGFASPRVTHRASGHPELSVSLVATATAQSNVKAIDASILGTEQHGVIIGALDSGKSAALNLNGDSTGYAPAPTSAVTQWFWLLCQDIGLLSSNYRVQYKGWDASLQDMAPWSVIQAGSAGERYARFPGPSNGRSLRLNPTSDIVTPTNDYDIRIKVSLDTWAAAAIQTIVARQGGVGFRGFTWSFQTNGDLKLTWFPNSGSEANQPLTALAANLALVNGTAKWLRFTIVASSGVATIYTGTDENTWTSVATTTVGATTVGDPGTSVFWEIGGRGGSTEVITGNIYDVEIRNGIGGYVLNPEPIDAWQAPFAGTFGGSPTLYCYNGSEPGKGLDWFNGNLASGAARLPMMIRNTYPSIQYLSTSKNDVLYRGPVLWGVLNTWLAAAKARAPGTAIIVVGQNPSIPPSSSPDQHAGRVMEEMSWAAVNNLGVANVYRNFERDPRGVPALTQSDGIHPLDPPGSLAWEKTVFMPFLARSHH